jgi:hypothetical protein
MVRRETQKPNKKYALRRERARQPHSHSSHKKTISEADLLSHKRAVCPSSRAISGRWRWLHASTPLSQRATALWPHSMSAWRPCARLRGNVWLYATSFERSAYTDANQLPTALSGSPYGAYVEKISRCRRDTNVGVRPAPPDTLVQPSLCAPHPASACVFHVFERVVEVLCAISICLNKCLTEGRHGRATRHSLSGRGI